MKESNKNLGNILQNTVIVSVSLQILAFDESFDRFLDKLDVRIKARSQLRQDLINQLRVFKLFASLHDANDSSLKSIIKVETQETYLNNMAAIIFDLLLNLLILFTNFNLSSELGQIDLKFLAEKCQILYSSKFITYFWNFSFKTRVQSGPSKEPSVTFKIVAFTIG